MGTPANPAAANQVMADQVLAALTAQVGPRLAAMERQIAETGQGRRVTPAKPEKYTGRPGKAEQWAFEMELYYAATSMGDQQKVPFAAAMLTEHAAIWWRSMCLDPDGAISTWDEFKRQLLFNFQHVDAEKTARRRLRFLRQRTSVAAFFTDFTRATLEIPRITEDEKMDRFLAGLKPNLQREIILREPADYTTMVKLAHKLDEVIYSANRDPSYSSRFQDRSGDCFGDRHGSRPMELGAIQQGRHTSNRRPFGPSRGSDSSRPLGPSRGADGAGPSRFRNLAAADRVQLRSEGRCFYCKEHGHIAEYCPNKPGNERKAGKAPAR